MVTFLAWVKLMTTGVALSKQGFECGDIGIRTNDHRILARLRDATQTIAAPYATGPLVPRWGEDADRSVVYKWSICRVARLRETTK